MFKKFLLFIGLFTIFNHSFETFAEIIPLKKPIQTIKEKEQKLLIDVLKPLQKPLIKKGFCIKLLFAPTSLMVRIKNRFEYTERRMVLLIKINAIIETIDIGIKKLSPGFFENFKMISGIKAKQNIYRGLAILECS